MKKYTLLELTKMLQSSGTITGNDPMAKVLNKMKKNKKLTVEFLEMINPLLATKKFSDKELMLLLG